MRGMDGLSARQTRQALETCYGLRPTAIRRVAGAVFRCRLESGESLFLKCLAPLFHPKAEILGQLYASVAREGFTPPLQPDSQGRLVSSFLGQRLLLQKAIPTSAFAAVSGRRLDRRGASRLGASLALLHETLRCTCSNLDLPSQFDWRADVLAECSVQLGMPEGAAIVRRCLAAPRQPIHGDVHPGNVRLTADRAIFLDFDSACLAPPRAEAAFAAYRIFPTSSDRAVFLESYTAGSGGALLDLREMLEHVFTIVLTRVHFIVSAVASQKMQYLYDLPAQLQRLDHVRQALLEAP